MSEKSQAEVETIILFQEHETPTTKYSEKAFPTILTNPTKMTQVLVLISV